MPICTDKVRWSYSWHFVTYFVNFKSKLSICKGFLLQWNVCCDLCRSYSPLRQTSLDGMLSRVSNLMLPRPSASETNLRKVSLGVDPVPRPGSALGLLQGLFQYLEWFRVYRLLKVVMQARHRVRDTLYLWNNRTITSVWLTRYNWNFYQNMNCMYKAHFISFCITLCVDYTLYLYYFM